MAGHPTWIWAAKLALSLCIAVNGYQTERQDREKFSDHRRRVVADEAIAAASPQTSRCRR